MEEEKRRVKIHKFEFYVVDHEGYGADNCEIELENAKYLHAQEIRCLGTRIVDWHDDCPYNKTGADFKGLFSEPQKDLGEKYMNVFAIERKPGGNYWHDTVYINEEYAKHQQSEMYGTASPAIYNVKKIQVKAIYEGTEIGGAVEGLIDEEFSNQEVSICWKDGQDVIKEKALSKLSEEERKSLGIYS